MLKKIYFLLLIWLYLISFYLYAETQNTNLQEKDIPVSTHYLSNTELLEQLQTETQKIQYNLLAELRAVAEKKAFLIQHQEQAINLEIKAAMMFSISQDLDKKIDKDQIEQAQTQLDYLEQQQKHYQIEKTLLEAYYQQVVATETAINSFINELKNIDLLILQVQLRIEDGSLKADEIPETLSKAALKAQRQNLKRQLVILEETSIAIQTKLNDNTNKLTEVEQAILSAQTAYQALQARYEQQRKRQDLQQQYMEQSSEELISLLKNLEQEWRWLSSNFNKIKYHLDNYYTQLEDIKEQLNAMQAPDSNSLNTLTAQDVEQANTLLEQITVYHQDKLQLLVTYKRLLNEIITQGEALQEEGAVLNPHLFKMSVISSVLEKKIKEETLIKNEVPQSLRLDVLISLDKELSDILVKAITAIEKAKQDLIEQNQEKEASEQAITQAKQRLDSLEKEYQIILKMQTWEADLKDLPAEDIIAIFKEKAEALETIEKTLTENEFISKTLQENAQIAIKQLITLKDPFMRELYQAKQDELTKISNVLYTFAEIAPPEVEETAQENMSDVTDLKTKAENSQQEDTQLNPKAVTLKTYQNKLSGLFHINQEKAKQNKIILKELQTLETEISTYIKNIEQAYEILQQYHSSAIELKKRVSQGKLAAIKLPDEITQALKQDKIEAFAKLREALLYKQSLIQQNITQYSQKDAHFQTRQDYLSEVIHLTGKELDDLEQIDQLVTAFAQKRSELSDIEQKSLEQAARRQIEQENSIAELFLLFFHSEQIDNLTDILQEYYLELSEFNRKQDNLSLQKTQNEHIIETLAEEKAILEQLIPLLEQRLSQLEQQFSYQETVIKIQLVPEKTNILLTAYKNQFDDDFIMPIVIPQQQREAHIIASAKALFEIQIQKQALIQWIEYFKQRIGAKGIEEKIGLYQNNIAELTAQQESLARQIAIITGHSHQDLVTLSANEKPHTSLEKLRFKEGEIGVLRADRLQLYKETLYLIFFKILVILLASFIIIMIINFFMKRHLKHIETRIDNGEDIDKSAISIQKLFHTILNFTVGSISLILCLDAIGFNVAAILAGLGIGGFAVAMAAKGILADLLGGITIMGLRLYKIGDMIEFKDKWYIVKEIGLRYTILEDFSYNYKMTTPNAMLAESEIVNISSHPGFTILTNLYLSTANSGEKIIKAVKLIEEVIRAHAGARFIWVKHDHFDNNTFTIRIHYDILKFKERAKVETDINSQIVTQMQQHEIDIIPVSKFLS